MPRDRGTHEPDCQGCASRMWLTVRSGPDEGKTAQVAGPEFVIGREEGCDLVIAGDRRVSRRHAALRSNGDGSVVLVDLGSANGTFVNGRRLDSPHVLTGDEQIRVGDTDMSVAFQQPPPDTGQRPKDPRVGTTIGRYRIDDLIAVGGMGAVYLAEHLRLGKKVALKVLASRFAHDERFRERFVGESRMAAALDDPHIIPIYDADEVDGELFIAMKYVKGIDLATLIDDEGPLDLERTLSIIDQVGHALDAAHARGLVHRDVKPGNVLIASGAGADKPGHAYLCDFGVMKQTGNGGGLTLPGQAIGTVNYMAPEQVLGEQVDNRTDIYALGCVLYECLTGYVPFRRDSQEGVMWAHVHQDPPKVTELRPDLPPSVDAVVAKAMAKPKKRRYSSCVELVAAARSVVAPGIDTAEARRMAREATVASPEPPAGPTVAERGAPAPIPVGAGPPPPPPPPGATFPEGPLPPAPAGLIGPRTVAEGMPGTPGMAGMAGVPAYPGAPSVPRVPDLPPSPPPAQSKWRRPLLIGIPVAVVAVAAILVVVLSGGGGGGGPTRPLSPADAKVKAEPSSITLTWRQPSAGGEAVAWKVSRDNRLLEKVTEPRYEDDAVGPGQHYTYRIVAIGEGNLASRAAVVPATTPVPPIADARVEGSYDVHYRVVASHGYSGHYTGTQFDQVFVFTPQCSTGACDLKWQDQQEKGLAPSIFTRSGALYTTRTSGDFSVTCNGTPVTSFLNISLRVVQAKVRGGGGGEWVATKLTGSMEENEDATGTSCNASGATDRLVVTLSP